MTTPILRRRTALLSKVEATVGTFSSPTTSNDGVEVYNLQLNIPRDVSEVNPLGSGLSPGEPILNRSNATLSFGVLMKGAGSAGAVPDAGACLQGCGLGQTIASGTSVTYKPVSTGARSVSFELYQDGLRWRISGARGNVKFMFGLSSLPMMEFNFVGIVEKAYPDAATFPSTISVDATKAIGSKLATLTFGGISMAIANWEIDVGNEVYLPDSINEDEGYLPAEITDRRPRGSFDPQATTANNLHALMDANLAHAIAWSNNGAAGNLVELNCPKAVLTNVGDGDRNGVTTYPAEFITARNTGDDEIEVIFK